MKKEFKENIDNLLRVNLEINSLLQTDSPHSNTGEDGFAEFEEKVEKLLIEKDVFIENLKSLKEKSTEEFAELKESFESWQRVQELEKENLTSMQAVRSLLSKGAVDSKIQSKVISSYKSNKEVQPRLFDDSL